MDIGKFIRFGIIFLMAMAFSPTWANLARVSYIEGKATIFSGKRERPVRVNTVLKSGDIIKTGSETLLEIQYGKGSVIRIGENAEFTLKGDDNVGGVELNKGRVWANVQKLATGQFGVTTPVATAAVRGTIFRVDADVDSSSTVALYQGKVDVGPPDTTNLQAPAKVDAAWGPPVEVPGPYEVTLETWIRLNPGKQIHVRWGGAYSTSRISESEGDAWIKWNQTRDEALKRVGH